MKSIKLKIGVVLFLAIVTTYFSILSYDRFLIALVNSYDSNIEESYGIYFNQVKEIDRDEFMDVFTEMLQQYDLNACQLALDEFQNATIYTYSDDEGYMERIVLENGEVENLQEFDSYSTFSKTEHQRLYTVMRTSSLALNPFDLDDPAFYPLASYTVTANKDNSNISLMADELRNRFDGLQVDVVKKENHASLSFFEYYIGTELLLLYCLVAGIFAMVFMETVFKKIKQIVILKLEGMSGFRIYLKNIFLEILKTIPILLFLNIVIYSVIIHRFSADALFYWLMNVIYIGIWYGFILLFSLLLFAFIQDLNINKVIKNMNPFRSFDQFVHICRCVLFIFCLGMLDNGLNDLKYLLDVHTYQAVNEKRFQNQFQFGIWLFEGNYIKFIGTDELRNINHQLYEENEVYECLLMQDRFEMSNGNVPMFTVDAGYLVKERTISDMHEIDTPAFLIPKQYANENLTSQFEKYAEIYALEDYSIYSYEKEIENLDPYDSLTQPYLDDAVLLYRVNNYDGDYQISSLSFSYDGSLEECQAYIDQLFIDNGLRKSFVMNKTRNQQEYYIDYKVRNSFLPIVNLFLFSVLIFLLDIVLYAIYHMNHKKRLIIENIENVGNNHFFKVFCIPILAGDLFVYFFSRNCTLFFRKNLLIYFILEFVLLYFVHRISKQRRRWRD